MRYIGKIKNLTFCALLSACTNIPHNDVVIFATSTKVALDISPSATSGGVPSFTLGYKRDEGVWMPLVMNGQKAVLLRGEQNCTGEGNQRECYSISPAALNLFDRCMAAAGKRPDSCLGAALGSIKYIGTDGKKQDTYSVFASFGGDFSAAGGGKAGINQFFATGIAAQNLAKNKEVAAALTVTEPDAAAAKAATEQARLSTQVALRALGAKDGTSSGDTKRKLTDEAIVCWNKGRIAYAQVAHSKLDTVDKELADAFDSQDEADLRDGIEASPDRILLISEITKSVCPAS